MKENKKYFIIAILGLIAGIAFIAYGINNLLKSNNDVLDNQEPTPNEETTTATEEEVKDWLTDNASVVSYLIDFETDFDLEKALKKDYSDLLGWNFLMVTTDEGIPIEDSKYTYEYVILKENIAEFFQNLFGKEADVFDVSAITLSKEYFNFISEDEQIKVQVLATDFMPNQKWTLDNINIVSDDEIIITYASADYSCEPITIDCYTGFRKLILKKSETGFHILKSFADSETINNNEKIDEENTEE